MPFSRHAANLVSAIRLILAPAVVWLLLDDRGDAAFLVFVVAALLDGVDGWLARSLNAVSVLGSYIDPLADKVLILSSVVTLGVLGWLPVWLVVAIILRDVQIVAGAIAMHGLTRTGPRLRPLMISKINTVVVLVLIAATLAEYGFGWQVNALRVSLQYAAMATTVASALAYAYVWSRYSASH